MGLGFVCGAQSIPENWIKRWNWKNFIALGINQESEEHYWFVFNLTYYHSLNLVCGLVKIHNIVIWR